MLDGRNWKHGQETQSKTTALDRPHCPAQRHSSSLSDISSALKEHQQEPDCMLGQKSTLLQQSSLAVRAFLANLQVLLHQFITGTSKLV